MKRSYEVTSARIGIETKQGHELHVSQLSAPVLFAAWNIFVDYQRQCLAAPHHWQAVLDAANAYLATRSDIEAEDTAADVWAAVETPAPETIDLTPRGMTTPEGCARTATALDAWNASAHTVANLAANLLAARQNGTVTGYDWEELEQAIQVRAAKQEEFLRAVAGAPSVK